MNAMAHQRKSNEIQNNDQLLSTFRYCQRYHATAPVASVRTWRVSIIFILLVISTLHTGSFAFNFVRNILGLGTKDFLKGRLIVPNSLASNNILPCAKSDDERPPSTCVDPRLAPLQTSPQPRKRRANQALVPHSGRHFYPSHPAYRRQFARRWFWKLRKRKRFMEGWYYRLTLKNYESDSCNDNQNENKPVSFAFIISIEDPGITSSNLRLACIQAIGPNDQYLVQATKDDTKFWASEKSQSLGCIFEEICSQNTRNSTDIPSTITQLQPDLWKQSVRSGFQIIDDSLSRTSKISDLETKPRWLGRIRGHDGSKSGVLDGQGIPGQVEFDFEVDPKSVCGYGGYVMSTSGAIDSTQNISTQSKTIAHDAQQQKSTGGWLSSFPVFEPHWQVTIADALASGSINYNGTQYKFKDQAFYAEKNWGHALPSKWYWTQCNSFDNYEGELSVTAGGGIRKLPFGKEEELGMIAVHYKGRFFEAVPWKGNVEWNVSTWGEWSLYGDRLEETTSYGLDKVTRPTTTTPFAVEIKYRCDPKEIPGLVFRAPTPKKGMVKFCRDTFEAHCELTLWELKRNEKTKELEKIQPPIIDRATSKEGGAEIGGGPFWDEWQGKSKLKPVVKSLLNFPGNLLSSRRSRRERRKLS